VGRGSGGRTNAQGLDLNRDYAKLQSPEIAAVVALLQRFDPALYIDVHVSDGTDSDSTDLSTIITAPA